jgi:signal transduction histidine kinase/CheY-like chemotaxis protein
VDLPEVVIEYLTGIYTERLPAYLVSDEHGVLVASGGSVAAYNLNDLKPGSPVASQMPFLEGHLPLRESPLFLPDVRINEDVSADAHVFRKANQVYVLLLKSAKAESQQPVPQQAETVYSFEAMREAWQTEAARGRLLQERRLGERRRYAGTYGAPSLSPSGISDRRVGDSERVRSGDWARKSEAQLLHAQKLEAVGRLAGGVAHDFNNLLTVILGYSEGVLSRLKPDDEYRREIDEIRKAAQRAARLTRQLLAFGRRQLVRPETLDLGRTVTEVHMLLRRVIGEDIDLHVHVSPGLGMIHADGGQISQVLMNLVVNSRDAMPNGGQLRIGLSNVDVERPLTSESGQLSVGRYVRLTVADTGCGMDEETLACIFEPFFTTKQGGSGLGLSTAYGITKQSGGEIHVESELGRGTTFTLDFPRVDVPPLPVRQPVHEVLTPSGNETVLIVDDEIHVGRLVAATLQSRGYRTLLAFHPDNAESLAAAHPGDIDLLLTDMVLPSCNGVDLARAIVRHRPGIRTLFMSGYTEEGPGEAAPFLQKPFSSSQLARKVREVLDRPENPPV